MKKILILLFGVFAVLSAKPLEVEKTLIEGELENGFKYSIKKNEKPKNMASFRLVVKVGSLEEDDDQKGIAHLIEHLAFNGSKHFKGNSLVNFLESLGVDFGSHLNASTTTTETIYQLEIPLKGDNLDKTMLVFSDWAGGLELTQKELDKERGVVLEEKRARNSSDFRIYKQIRNVFYDKSRYADRLPIGDENIIKNISLKRVKDFYDTWYEPRFMNFIAVGDFDEKEIEKLIKKSFGGLKNRNKNKRYSRDTIKSEDTRFEIFKDKEVTSMGLNISFVAPYKKMKSEKDYKEAFVADLVTKLFNIKAKELEQKRNPFAKDIKVSQSLVSKNLKYYSFRADFLSNDGLKAFGQVLNLIYSVEENGFNKRDFEIIKRDLIAKNSDELKKMKNKTSSSYAHDIAYHKAYDEIFIDKEYAIKLEEKLLKEITLDELNRVYKKILQSKGRVIYFVIPDDYKITLEEIKRVFEDRKKGIKKEKEVLNLPKSIDIGELKPSKIVSEKHDKKYDFYEFTLANGVKVVYKYNDYEKDKVLFQALSKGGFSLYETKLLPSATKSAKIINDSGLGKYNSLEVKKIYADKIVSVEPVIDRYFEGFSGDSSKKDFKYLLEGVYLLATKYKVDENILFNTKMQLLEKLEKEKNSPQTMFMNEYKKFYFNGNKRYIKATNDEIKAINKDDILRVYKDRFSDFNNFVFFIIGDVEKDEVEKYIRIYLGNLPTKKRDESYKNRGQAHIKGSHEFLKHFNNQNISIVFFTYKKLAPFSIKEEIELKALKEVLEAKLREYMREEKSGVYGVGVSTYFQRLPDDEAAIRIHFACDPKRRVELAGYVRKIIENIKKEKVDKKYVNAFVKKSIVAIDEESKNNSFWKDEFKEHYKYGKRIVSPKEYKELYRGITPKAILDSARKYLDGKDFVYAELNPKDDLKKGKK